MKILPIGSVVLLKGANKKLMIYGLKQEDIEAKVTYDYVGCLFPEGNIDANSNYLFNGVDIEKVYFVGYMDEEQEKFLESIPSQLFR
ncbi:DUF4176 domain-containing protein [Clostridium felsineum]|uniref:Uncharacterized protein n=1 Tax=Clostridium felsineum TaxID=36839 RepID=A0A1S8LJJ0_9CLOT|nr:DUF4176 domain-containing protein [Clostridium felsineum]MCR3758701.1 DUF4176 domain-containing protein [Clostridium felsineum]URZ04477.1 hypothetical protein CLAUR_045660 [Clostridium felsineum]URZ09280.1 hypothetical protein CLROS_046960 [Clostridium felsineum]URZ13966.1 hypothetical protein CROST_047440 [Clostridium felsineum]URZ18475.1 hypothetical protein CLFE_045630 [Clostridium felsineum DSM 794]